MPRIVYALAVLNIHTSCVRHIHVSRSHYYSTYQIRVITCLSSLMPLRVSPRIPATRHAFVHPPHGCLVPGYGFLSYLTCTWLIQCPSPRPSTSHTAILAEPRHVPVVCRQVPVTSPPRRNHITTYVYAHALTLTMSCTDRCPFVAYMSCMSCCDPCHVLLRVFTHHSRRICPASSL